MKRVHFIGLSKEENKLFQTKWVATLAIQVVVLKCFTWTILRFFLRSKEPCTIIINYLSHLFFTWRKKMNEWKKDAMRTVIQVRTINNLHWYGILPMECLKISIYFYASLLKSWIHHWLARLGLLVQLDDSPRFAAEINF